MMCHSTIIKTAALSSALLFCHVNAAQFLGYRDGPQQPKKPQYRDAWSGTVVFGQNDRQSWQNPPSESDPESSLSSPSTNFRDKDFSVRESSESPPPENADSEDPNVTNATVEFVVLEAQIGFQKPSKAERIKRAEAERRKEKYQNAFMEVMIYNKELDSEKNPLFETKEFQSLDGSEQKTKDEIIQKTKIRCWNPARALKILHTLEQWNLITPEVTGNFLVEKPENGGLMWRYRALLRAFKLSKDHVNKDGFGRIKFKLDLWENDYVLHKDSEAPGGCCSGGTKSFRVDYWDKLTGETDLETENLKQEVYEYCRIGIISRSNIGTNKCSYDYDVLHMRCSEEVLLDVRTAAYKQFIKNDNNPDHTEEWWLKELNPEERWQILCWKKSCDEVEVMQYETIRPKKDRRIVIPGIGVSYEDHLEAEAKRIQEEAQHQAQTQRELNRAVNDIGTEGGGFICCTMSCEGGDGGDDCTLV